MKTSSFKMASIILFLSKNIIYIYTANELALLVNKQTHTS